MKTTTTINIILIFACLSILTFIAYIIYLNRASDQMVGITIKSFLIPVIAGAGLLFIEFMKPIENFEKDIHLGFAEDPKVMMRLNKGNGLELHEGIMDYALLLNKVSNDTLKFENHEEEINFIQCYIINSFIKRYNSHWESIYEKENWFFDQGSSSTYNENEAEENPQKITVSTLKQKLKNKYLDKLDGADLFYLPKESKITFGNNSNEIVNIKTKHITISIIDKGGNETALVYDGSKTANKILKDLQLERKDENNIRFYGYTLKYVVTVNRLTRWSPDTLKELEWAKGYFEYLNNRMGWENFMNSFKKLQQKMKDNITIILLFFFGIIIAFFGYKIFYPVRCKICKSKFQRKIDDETDEIILICPKCNFTKRTGIYLGSTE